jgi:hypothetical protein
LIRWLLTRRQLSACRQCWQQLAASPGAAPQTPPSSATTQATAAATTTSTKHPPASPSTTATFVDSELDELLGSVGNESHAADAVVSDGVPHQLPMAGAPTVPDENSNNDDGDDLEQWLDSVI